MAAVKKTGWTWTAFGFCKENHLSSKVIELENLSYHSYDYRSSSRLSIARALATSSKTASIREAHIHHQKELTKDTVQLDQYLLSAIYKGTFSLNLPLKSSRLNLMMPNCASCEHIKGQNPTVLTTYMYGFMQAIKERCYDMTKRGYAELVGVMVAFQCIAARICWRFCSYKRDGSDFLFGSLVGEYIDAVNQKVMAKPLACCQYVKALLRLQGKSARYSSLVPLIGRLYHTNW